VDEAIVIAEEDGVTATGVLGAELAALRGELDERTRDLQRVSAEYANYRKRVDRDRALVGEQATGSVLASLLPVLDDLDRAREHGDLVGPFGTVADQLIAALGKFGLTPFGEKGDPFDPTRHEAVAHLTSAEVTEPTCVDILRRGYQLGERLLRPALVAVADPE
jgi:molecular chaperone GrpE